MLVLLSAVAPVLFIVAPVAYAHGRLDSSFGENGRIEVKDVLHKGRNLGQVAPTVDGPIYFTEETFVCRKGPHGTVGAPCREEERLRRFGRNGRLDDSYAPGNKVFPGLRQEVELTTDANGLPVFGWNRDHRVRLRRLLPDGRPDPDFGDGGTVTLGCRCSLEAMKATGGKGLLVSAVLRRHLKKSSEPRPITYWFEKLNANGSPDRAFGRDGIAEVRTRIWADATATPGARGSVLVTGEIAHQHSGPRHYAARLTPDGRLDRGFGKAVVDTALSTYARDGIRWEELYAFPQARDVEFFASTSGKTVVFRSRSDGQLDPGFGHRGETRIDVAFADAAPAGDGRLFVVGYKLEPWYVHMVDRDGHLDHRFGTVLLPGAFSEYGMSIYPDGPGRAIVVSPGETLCDEGCETEPRIYRVIG